MENRDNEFEKKQVLVEGQEKQEKVNYPEPEEENLGLDADGSSKWSEGEKPLNNDNDRVTGNPDGEDDSHDSTVAPGHSPLMDK
ncbi:hypothetical protein PBAL39_01352 [Pedobacter sp. BAL39]|uniref:hypothetical protein n=1 Tax=Pedobacter sp. BAL39 TaxID=391596 RepID=UPI00015594AD|nr:hypothetical protein [Pedobacter sp. BAL39]EDM38219.1 hypothetical protein PBAL39_01352 [Pedobacter sp. BAL39]